MKILRQIKKSLLWFVRPKRYKHLYQTIKSQHPRHIMEIGTWNGERAVRMLNLASQFHPTAEIHYYGFDLFEEMTPEIYDQEISKFPPSQQEVRAQLEATGANIHLYQGDTTKTMPTLMNELPKMDFVFLDGGHSIATIASDWACVERVMDNETVVIFDDYWPDKTDSGAKVVVDAIDTDRYAVTILNPQDRVQSDWGPLKINFARVTQKPDLS